MKFGYDFRQQRWNITNPGFPGGRYQFTENASLQTGMVAIAASVSGKVVAWMILPMSLSLVYEVVARYVFNAPTIWASDVSQILYGMFFMLGSAYALQRQQHIRTDFIYGKWSVRTRGLRPGP